MRPFHLALLSWVFVVASAEAADKAPEKPHLVFDSGGHTATVRRVFFANNGEQLVTVSYDKTVRVWDVLTGEPLKVLRLPVGPGDDGQLNTAALAADGKTLAVTGFPVAEARQNILVYLISLDSGKVERVLKPPHGETVQAMAFSPDGKYLLTSGGDKKAIITEISTGKVVKTLEGHTDRVSGVDWSPDSTQVVTCSWDKSSRVWSLATGRTTAELQGHSTLINCVAWSPDGKTIATGVRDGTIRIYNPDGTFLRSHLDPKKEHIQITSVTYRKGTSELLYTGIGSRGRAGMLDLVTGNVRVAFNGHTNTVMNGTLSPDGRLAATTGGDAHETFIWTTADGAAIHKLQGKGYAVFGVGWSPDGKSIAWGNTNRGWSHTGETPLERSFRLNELEFGEAPRDKQFQRVKLQSGSLGLEMTRDFVLLLKNGDKATPFKMKSPADRVYCFTIVDDKRAAVGTAFGLFLVDVEANKILKTYHGHSGIVLSVSLSPDGRTLLSGGTDQTMRLWDLERDEPLMSMYVTGTEWVAWSPEGYYAASAYGERLMGWQINHGPEQMGDYHPAVQFRRSLYRPDLIRVLPEAGSLAKALALVGKDKKPDVVSVAEVLPPEVTITSPNTPSGTRITGSKLEVKATAHSVGKHPVTALRLIVDGRPYKGGQRPVAKPALGEVSETWSVDLIPGKHTLAIQAESPVSKGLSSFVEVTRAGAGAGSDLPALYVLAVGVSKYPGRMRLTYAASDADALSEAFKQKVGKAFRKVEVKVLKDHDATKRGILEGLAWLEKNMSAQDVAVFSFSGHGMRDDDGKFYFLPIDVNLKGLEKSCVSGDELKNALAEVPGRVVVILDACHSGSTTLEDRSAPPSSADLVRDLVTDDYGVITLCSSLGREYSLEGPDVARGYFTHALIEGLSGEADYNKDGVVHLSELDRYAYFRVRELTRGMQHPTTGKPASMRSFPLAVK